MDGEISFLGMSEGSPWGNDTTYTYSLIVRRWSGFLVAAVLGYTCIMQQNENHHRCRRHCRNHYHYRQRHRCRHPRPHPRFQLHIVICIVIVLAIVAISRQPQL